MPTPSLYPLYMKAASGGSTAQVIQGELLLQMEAEPDILLEDEEVSVVLDQDTEVVLPEEEVEVIIDVS